MIGGDAVCMERCPGTRHPGVTHVAIKGVGHFMQDGGAEQLVSSIQALLAAAPAAAMLAKRAAEAAAEEREVAHGDVGISTPSDGVAFFIAQTTLGRAPYQRLTKQQQPKL
jgi:hypothetical protein